MIPATATASVRRASQLAACSARRRGRSVDPSTRCRRDRVVVEIDEAGSILEMEHHPEGVTFFSNGRRSVLVLRGAMERVGRF